ncbi:hypothetical protein [Rheinheimera sp. 4Y26]|uniref:hypothetical protein n=1 Tax=Rheinheimera sp. 4Y26 TaxID=2977811 RepID=UPI0021B10402|nr:hypothetical protein [Rheinheimera sp. 4Y26]MCT6700893.1 hypothetical protein [Rheinheimera sp. 4Y26]
MNKHELAWNYMKQKDCFLVSEVANAVDMDIELCRKSIKRLEEKGCVQVISGIGVAGRPFVYKVIASNDAKPQFGRGGTVGNKRLRKGKTGQQLIWNSLRINRVATVSMIVAVTQVSERTVYRYLNSLEKAGYVSCRRPSRENKSNQERIGEEGAWVLRRETGPKAPILRRSEGFWDQNEQKLYPFQQVGGQE